MIRREKRTTVVYLYVEKVFVNEVIDLTNKAAAVAAAAAAEAVCGIVDKQQVNNVPCEGYYTASTRSQSTIILFCLSESNFNRKNDININYIKPRKE